MRALWGALLLPTLSYADDLDGDGFDHTVDLCPAVWDDTNADANGDGFGDACVHPTTTVGAGSTIDNTAFVLPRASIGANTDIDARTVIARRAAIGDDGDIGMDDIIGNNDDIGDRVTLEDDVVLGSSVIIDDDAIVRTGSRVSNLVIIGDSADVDGRIGRKAEIGASARVLGANVAPGVDVGAGATLEPGARVRRGTTVGSGATIGMNATVGRNVRIGSNAFVGSGATIRGDVVLGANAIVGLGEVVPRGTVVAPTTVALTNGARRWSDGSTAIDCAHYRFPQDGEDYSGDVGDGLYTVQPDGFTEVDVYCDMSTDDGGWTLVSVHAGGTLATPSAVGTVSDPSQGTDAKLSDALINELRGPWTDSVFRMNCGGTSYFQEDKVFQADGAGSTAILGCAATSDGPFALASAHGAHFGLNNWGQSCGTYSIWDYNAGSCYPGGAGGTWVRR